MRALGHSKRIGSGLNYELHVHTVTNKCDTVPYSGMLGTWLAARALLPYPRTLLISLR
ncbi:hypothetical protein GCM10025779_32480 [Arthrobacter cryoconiti]